MKDMKKFNHGTVLKLTREDNEESIRLNFSQMRQCGLDTVVVWPAAFWWEEKTENYPFATGKKVLELAEEYGLKIIMELAGQLTVMEYIPDFLMKPEYNPIDENGNRIYGQTSFGFLNYFHPEVKQLICEHYKKAAEAYRDYPALLGYDVFNETMFRSFDEYTLDDFRDWLKEKYETIEKLNQVWERTFSDFSQISYEPWKWMSVMPEADFLIWRKEAIARFLKPWCDAIKEVDDKHALIIDNIHSQVAPTASYGRPQGDFEIATVADIVGMSFYPKQQNSCMSPALRWEIFDGYDLATGRKGFYISEMQTHIQALFNPGTCVKVSELKQWCFEAYSAGAAAIIYWMWRPFTKGVQTLGRGLVNYRNKPTERFALVKEISKTFKKFGVLRPVKSKVGVLYSRLSDDVSRRYTSSYSVDDNFYNKSVFGAYKAFCDNNVRPDVITVDELENYKCVVLSNTCVISNKEAEMISTYVKNGGTIIVDGKFSVVDEESMQHPIIPGGNLHLVTGEIYFETDNNENSFTVDQKQVDFFYGKDSVELETATVLGRFTDGSAAFVKNNFGKGCAYTFNLNVFYSYLEKEFLSIKELVASLIDELDLSQVKTDAPIMLRLAEADGKTLVFAFNYTDNDIDTVIEVGGKRIKAFVKKNDVEILEA